MRTPHTIIPGTAYYIYIDGRYWCGSTSLEKIRKEYTNMLVCGVEKEAITIMKLTKEKVEV